MADKRFQSLPGFRDFTPRDCAVRNYLFSVWRDVAHRYGFSEYEAPIVESTDLYLKKSGGELTTQLFRFEDQGGRDITLCLLYTSPSPRDQRGSRMPSSA